MSHRERYTPEQLASRREERDRAARAIDPSTAHGGWTYEQVLDPYGDFELTPEEECAGRCYWLFDPSERIWITETDVRKLHPDVPEADWRDLMRAALRRDAEADPLSEIEIRFNATVGRALGYGPEGYRAD